MKLTSLSIPRERIPFSFLHIHNAIGKTTNRSFQGIGVGLTSEQAFMLAKYELYERLAGSFLVNSGIDSVVGDKFSLLNEGLLVYDLSRIELFHDEQEHRLAAVNESVKNNHVSWTQCTLSTTSHKVYLPSTFIFFDYPSNFYLPNTSGSAIHTDVNQAHISAMYELIEKSIIAQMWYLQKIQQPDYFVLEDALSILPSVYQELLRHTVDFYFYHQSCYRTNIILCVCKFISEDGTEKISVGSSCNLDIDKSVKKAIDECMKNIVLLNNYIWLDQLKKFSKIERVTNFLSHFLYFNNNYREVDIPLLNQPKGRRLNLLELSKKEVYRSDYENSIYNDFMNSHEALVYKSTFRQGDNDYSFVRIFSPDFFSPSSHYKYPLLGNLRQYKLGDLYLEIPHFFP